MKFEVTRNTIQNIKFLNIFIIIMFGSKMGQAREKQNKRRSKNTHNKKTYTKITNGVIYQRS